LKTKYHFRNVVEHAQEPNYVYVAND